MSTDPTVRRFRSADGERVRDLNRAAMGETTERVPGAPDADLRDVRGHYLDAGGEFLVAERGDAAGGDARDEAVVATGAFEPLDGWMAERFDAADRAVELTRVRVAPEPQGRGVGTRVVEALLVGARRRGRPRAVLKTRAGNEQARGSYESLGFTLAREETVAFEGVTLDLALYRRETDG